MAPIPLPSVMQESSHIELIARGLILHQSRVLMCRSLKGNYYYLPGGHIEFGEPGSIALERELREEASAQITVGPLLLTTENTFHDGEQDHHEVSLVFHVEQLNGRDLTKAGSVPELESQEPHIDFVWIDLASASDLDVRPLEIKAWLASGGAGTTETGHLSSFELPVPRPRVSSPQTGTP